MNTKRITMAIACALGCAWLPLQAQQAGGAAEDRNIEPLGEDEEISLDELESEQEAGADVVLSGAPEGPVEDVLESAGIVEQMRRDEDMDRLLANARGVFIVPDYATASLLIGGAGGEGVLVQRQQDGWSDPIFYDIGSVSFGAQAGAAAGAIAMVLMSDQALERFMDENNFSVNAEAGLSIINWSERVRRELGEGQDIVLWTDTEGLLAEASIGFENISWDEEESREYYGTDADPRQIVTGEVSNTRDNPLSRNLEG